MYVHQINFRTVFETKYKKTQFSEKKAQNTMFKQKFEKKYNYFLLKFQTCKFQKLESNKSLNKNNQYRVIVYMIV